MTEPLIPAGARLRSIAREYGVTGGVFVNPALTGTTTKAQLLKHADGTRSIELRPNLDTQERVFAVLHEIAHTLRDQAMADDPDYFQARRFFRVLFQWFDAGKPETPYLEAMTYLQSLYREEERRVNSLALDLLCKLYGPRYATAETFEALGFTFEHRS